MLPNIKQVLFLIIVILALTTNSWSSTFMFKDNIDDIYEIRTFSVQEIFLNNAQIGIVDQKYEGNLKVVNKDEKGIATLDGTFLYYAKPTNSDIPYTLQNPNTTETKYTRAPNGKIVVPYKYYFPVVRDIPYFSKENFNLGEQWKAPGYECQDFRALGINYPFLIPLDVQYEYVKDDTYRGRDCSIIGVTYTIKYDEKPNVIKNKNDLRPVRIIGIFKGFYYWDKEEGYPLYYEGDYDFIYVLANGEIREFKGHDYGDVRKIKPKKEVIPPPIAKIPETKKEDIKKDIEDKLKENDVGFEVHKKDKNIVINLGEILFDNDSAELKSEYISKLDELAKILMKYDNFSMKVEGHTCNLGTKNHNLELSNNRASSVKKYLILKGVDPKKITSEGLGEGHPLVPNTNEEARKKNRRVEIVIDTAE